MSTKIEWTDATWNPIIGCSKASPGCENCYAETFAATRLVNMPATAERYSQVIEGGKWNGKTDLVSSQLWTPLGWRKPKRVFVCSMGDLFHESVPFTWIDHIFSVIGRCPRHTFQILTKRPQRMLEYFTYKDMDGFTAEDRVTECLLAAGYPIEPWPLDNVWLGTTVENQEQADNRIPYLLQCPAVVRFVSIEPMLGPVVFDHGMDNENCPTFYDGCNCLSCLDWVIIGCESGPKRRPMNIEWAHHLVNQCHENDTPVFVKQLSINGKVSKDMNDWPEELRIREFPKYQIPSVKENAHVFSR